MLSSRQDDESFLRFSSRVNYYEGHIGAPEWWIYKAAKSNATRKHDEHSSDPAHKHHKPSLQYLPLT